MDVQCIMGVGGVQASLAQKNEVYEAPPSHARYARVLALLVFPHVAVVNPLACLLWPLRVSWRCSVATSVTVPWRFGALLRRTMRPTSRTSSVRRCLLLRDTTSEFSTHWSRDSRGRSTLCRPMFGLRMAQWLRLPNRLRNVGSVFTPPLFSAQEHPVEACTTACSDLDRDRLIDGFSTEVVRDILATLAPGKAAGEDLVADELLRSGGEDMAALLSDLFVKSAAACSVPQEWRGGMVRNIHKKGPIDVFSNSRGILTSSCVGKVYGRALRRRLLPAALNYAADTQCGGFPGRSPEFASHCARLLAARCKTRGWSHATVFLDATSAFYSLMRQWVLGFNETEDCLRQLCAKIGIPNPEEMISMASRNPILFECWCI